MKQKILTLSISLILLSVAITSWLSVQMNMNSLMQQKESELQNYCELINRAITEDLDHGLTVDYGDYAGEFSAEIDQRVTFVAPDGKVIGDSLLRGSLADMENHGEREEIRGAIENGVGRSSRASATMGNQYLYVAAALMDRGELICVTRVAMEIDRVHLIGDFLVEASLKAAGAGIVIAIILSIVFAGRITRPIRIIVESAEKMARGDYRQHIEVRTGDELQELGETINDMSGKLALAVEEMEKAENIRREFVANVTHELKTPLTSISGFVETLQDGADENPEIRRKFLDIIAVEAARLKRLINDILVISDIESGREVNVDRDVNVREAVEEIVDFLQPQIEAKGISVSMEFAYEIYIGGSRDRFKQMMLNLIENAVKYSDAGGSVRIRVWKAENRIWLEVADDGQGIAPEDLPRIFERFYRVDKSRSQKAGGTGLGLAIVKHIAGLFGGEVKVESALGEGTAFTVILPE
ncbi:sensor histidine kinase [Bacilliculturomica massiliensis]|uniref:sensor histidine kinase n=1 Tax=Bacilliculturomica massiliensis TaxID=1917867 RepID=UPI00103172CB|nr:ATP-binding protein [Bacilliculturomica massiliensis]